MTYFNEKIALHPELDQDSLYKYANMKLVALGLPPVKTGDTSYLKIAETLLADHEEKTRLLSNYYCPSDNRILSFLRNFLKDVPNNLSPQLPAKTLILDRYGLGRMLSVPSVSNAFVTDCIQSYKVKQGVLHNTKNDRRTTVGFFHLVEGGFPPPADKKLISKLVFAKLWQMAINPPQEFLRLPFTSDQEKQAEIFVSMLLKPVVCPAIPKISNKKSMEIRFFAPGNFVSNLDFVENIFGNAGHPSLLENDSALDIGHWTGHTGCIILAPHLTSVRKKDVGLPNISEATERQKRDKMFWEDESEIYNEGKPFKIVARDESGVIVTILADNYYGYSKKIIKTQISFSANLYGQCEEEHSGGALLFPNYDLGDDFCLQDHKKTDHKFQDAIEKYSDEIEVMPEGYAVNRKYSEIVYVPENAHFSLSDQKVFWNEGKSSVLLSPKNVFVLPSGYRVKMVKHDNDRRWRLIGTSPNEVFFHKPSTVSGGGKSELSKSIAENILYGPVFVSNFKEDFDLVAKIIGRDYSNCYKETKTCLSNSKSVLDKSRSIGSVIKLLTPSSDYTDEYNEWLKSIPRYVKELVLIVKRFYKPEWQNDWLKHFSVDWVNGSNGNELKYHDKKLLTQYIRVGFTEDGHWKTFNLRQDFFPAYKVQMEDDVTVSTIVPKDTLFSFSLKPNDLLELRTEHPCISAENFESSCPNCEKLSQNLEKSSNLKVDENCLKNPNDWTSDCDYSVKLTANCEYRFFQRPDDVLVRGYDKQAESDLAGQNMFISNFEPMKKEDALNLVKDAVLFDKYTKPMQDLITSFLKDETSEYFVSSAHPRMIKGKPTENPRYLQEREDLYDPFSIYLTSHCKRLYWKIPENDEVSFGVNIILPGKRNNPPVDGVPALAVFNPLHFFELPELMRELAVSITGKSPAMTGFGSEGALTKNAFNSLCPIIDLNNALVSFILTGKHGFVTSSAYIGPKFKVEHDISFIVPEVLARMFPEERSPDFLIKNGFLDKCEDFYHENKKIQMSRLGYRMNINFVKTFFGRIFVNPETIFEEEILKPELQSIPIFIEGIENLEKADKNIANLYFEDGSINLACPPLKALLTIMRDGHFEGKTIESSEIRKLFTRDYLLNSDWYIERLQSFQTKQIDFWQNSIAYIENLMKNLFAQKPEETNILQERLTIAQEKYRKYTESNYWKTFNRMLGLDPSFVKDID